jgi:hypothetical protein
LFAGIEGEEDREIGICGQRNWRENRDPDITERDPIDPA